MNLMDCLIPQTPPEPKNARVVSLSGFALPVKMVENQKREQRKHWKENDRRKK